MKKKIYVVFLALISSVLFTKGTSELIRFNYDEKIQSSSISMVVEDVQEINYDEDIKKLDEFLIKNDFVLYYRTRSDGNSATYINYYNPGNNEVFQNIVEDSNNCNKYCDKFISFDISEMNLKGASYLYGDLDKVPSDINSMYKTLSFIFPEEQVHNNEEEILSSIYYFRLLLLSIIMSTALIVSLILQDVFNSIDEIRLHSMLGIKYRFVITKITKQVFRQYIFVYLLSLIIFSYLYSNSLTITKYNLFLTLLVISFAFIISFITAFILYIKIINKVKYKIKDFLISITSSILVVVSVILLTLISMVFDNYFVYKDQLAINKMYSNSYSILPDYSMTMEENKKLASQLINSGDGKMSLVFESDNPKIKYEVYTDKNFFKRNPEIILENGESVNYELINKDLIPTYDELYEFRDDLSDEDYAKLLTFDEMTLFEQEEFLNRFGDCAVFSTFEYQDGSCKTYVIQDNQKDYNAYSARIPTFNLSESLIYIDDIVLLQNIYIEANSQKEAEKYVMELYEKNDISSDSEVIPLVESDTYVWSYYNFRDGLISFALSFLTLIIGLSFLTHLLMIKNKEIILVNSILGKSRVKALSKVLYELFIVNILILLIIIFFIKTYISLLMLIIMICAQLGVVNYSYNKFVRHNLVGYVKGELQSD